MTLKGVSENKEFRLGFLIMGVYTLWALSWFIYSFFIEGSLSNPYLPVIDIKNELAKPFGEFLFGTDVYGRSLFELISQGLLYSFVVSLLVCSLSSIIGTIAGYLSVNSNSFFEKFFEFSTNLIFIFPSILIAIIFMSFSGQSVWALVFVLVFTSWPGYSRIVRGEVQRIIGLSYVEGDMAIGYSKTRLLFKTVLPAIFPQLLIHIVLGMSGVIISEATLGFLGLGGSQYSWGVLLSLSKTVLLEAPHIVIILSLLISGLIIGLNLMGDGLRDHLDPKS